MRTTLTLDPDVALKVRERLEHSSSTLKEVINDALRIGLAGSAAKPPKFRVIPAALALRPGIDGDKLNQVLDDLMVEEHVRRRGR